MGRVTSPLRRHLRSAALARVATLAVLGAGALLAVACEGGSGVQIVAVTRGSTPAPSSSGGSIVGGAPATPRAVSSSAQVPPRPDNPLGGSVAVQQYLASGRADVANCLPELVEAWDLAPVEGPRCLRADIDGDGHEELVFVVSVAGDVQVAADAWIFDDAAAGHRLLTSARALANQVLTNVSLLGAAELTGDRRADVVIAHETCGAATCVTDLVIASAHRGRLANLAPADAALAGLEAATIEPATADRLPALALRGGSAGSIGAGPQRGLTRVLTWNGLRFSVVDHLDEPRYLFHLVADADAAYRNGDYGAALRLYDQAVSDRSLADWKLEAGQAAGRPELASYASFRASLAAQRTGDPAGAMLHLRRAGEQFPNTLHGIAALVYAHALDEGRPASEACAAAETYLRQFSDQYVRVWDYGYGNPEHTIAGLCR